MNYVIVDTEGSGLFDFKKPADAPGQPRMAALGLILITDKFEIEEKHGWLIRPDGWTFDNNSEAAKKNGLTHEMLMADGVDVREPLRAYGDAIDQRRIVVGFNVPHDLKTLRAEARYVGFPDRYMQTRYICVMQGCRQLVDARTATGEKKPPRLEEACIHFGIDQGAGAHTGLGDAESAYQILLRLRDAGCVPAYTDPYDKGKPKKKPVPKARPQGSAYEQHVLSEQMDFIGGASEDGK
jgi:DNA polymerase III epsilon subunit-like protein